MSKPAPRTKGHGTHAIIEGAEIEGHSGWPASLAALARKPWLDHSSSVARAHFRTLASCTDVGYASIPRFARSNDRGVLTRAEIHQHDDGYYDRSAYRSH
jgi:hypothetical protein